MLAVGIVLSILGLGFFCWLLFKLAIYALPTLAGLAMGLAAFHSGAGVIGALIVGLVVGGAILALGQFTFAVTRTPLIRAICSMASRPRSLAIGYRLPWPASACPSAYGRRYSPWSAPSRVWRSWPRGQGTGSAYSPAEGRLHDQGR